MRQVQTQRHLTAVNSEATDLSVFKPTGDTIAQVYFN